MSRKEKPIIFSGPMVRAILEGRKTQTRRVIKKKYENTDLVIRTDKYGTRLIERQNDAPEDIAYTTPEGVTITRRHLIAVREVEPPYRRGDVLWVRETWNKNPVPTGWPYDYRATPEYNNYDDWETWRPSIFMPRDAARILLMVKDVRAERLNDISEKDAKAEGMAPITNNCGDMHRTLFARLWDKLNAKWGYDWNSDPWVWVITFERLKPADDIALGKAASGADQHVLRSAT